MIKKTQKKNNRARDEYTVVLEDLRSQFCLFGESLSGVSDTLDKHTKILERHTEQLTEINTRLANAEARLVKVEMELVFVKEQLAIIRHNQVTRDEFKLLETRVARLERSRK